MLKISGVKKDYPGFHLDCSMEVKPGQITGFIGANGTGKSTTFKAVLGLIRTDGGEIKLFGKDHREISPEDKKKLGVVLADSGFSGYLKVKDIVKVLGNFYPGFKEQFFMKKAQELGLPMDKQVKEFSTGMKAKLKVLAAVSHGAELLILDEPTVGLDVLARDQIHDLLRDCMEENENCSILISSHLSQDLESLCDDLYMIHDGKIIFHEDTDRLLGDYAVIKADETQYRSLDQSYILKKKQEKFGYSLLTDQKKFYLENYPGLVVENSSIDELIIMMVKGEDVRS